MHMHNMDAQRCLISYKAWTFEEHTPHEGRNILLHSKEITNVGPILIRRSTYARMGLFYVSGVI